MNTIKKTAWMVLLTIGLFYLPGISTTAVSAQKGGQDFVLINKTGVEINALYVTPHNANQWGEDILGAGTLPQDESLDITFSRTEKAKLWDLRIEDADGEFIEWTRINLLEVSSVTLYYKNGNATAIFDDFTPDISGQWNGFYDDGTASPFIWMVNQKGSVISVENVGKGARSPGKGSISGTNVRIADFATQNGKLSADGKRITWSDGVVWVKGHDLNGVWAGYYDDGTPSPYVWNIGHTGSTLTIQNAKAGGKERSRGTIQGNTIRALDFATKNGTLSPDGNRINWSDGVVWIRQ